MPSNRPIGRPIYNRAAVAPHPAQGSETGITNPEIRQREETETVSTPQGSVSVVFITKAVAGKIQTVPQSISKNVVFGQPISSTSGGFTTTGTATYTYSLSGNQLVPVQTGITGNVTFQGTPIATLTSSGLQAIAGAQITQQVSGTVLGTTQNLGTVIYTPTISGSSISLTPSGFIPSSFTIRPTQNVFQSGTTYSTSLNLNNNQIVVSSQQNPNNPINIPLSSVSGAPQNIPAQIPINIGGLQGYITTNAANLGAPVLNIAGQKAFIGQTVTLNVNGPNGLEAIKYTFTSSDLTSALINFGVSPSSVTQATSIPGLSVTYNYGTQTYSLSSGSQSGTSISINNTFASASVSPQGVITVTTPGISAYLSNPLVTTPSPGSTSISSNVGANYGLTLVAPKQSPIGVTSINQQITGIPSSSYSLAGYSVSGTNVNSYISSTAISPGSIQLGSQPVGTPGLSYSNLVNNGINVFPSASGSYTITTTPSSNLFAIGILEAQGYSPAQAFAQVSLQGLQVSLNNISAPIFGVVGAFPLPIYGNIYNAAQSQNQGLFTLYNAANFSNVAEFGYTPGVVFYDLATSSLSPTSKLIAASEIVAPLGLGFAEGYGIGATPTNLLTTGLLLAGAVGLGALGGQTSPSEIGQNLALSFTFSGGVEILSPTLASPFTALSKGILESSESFGSGVIGGTVKLIGTSLSYGSIGVFLSEGTSLFTTGKSISLTQEAEILGTTGVVGFIGEPALGLIKGELFGPSEEGQGFTVQTISRNSQVEPLSRGYSIGTSELTIERPVTGIYKIEEQLGAREVDFLPAATKEAGVIGNGNYQVSFSASGKAGYATRLPSQAGTNLNQVYSDIASIVGSRNEGGLAFTTALRDQSLLPTQYYINGIKGQDVIFTYTGTVTGVTESGRPGTIEISGRQQAVVAEKGGRLIGFESRVTGTASISQTSNFREFLNKYFGTPLPVQTYTATGTLEAGETTNLPGLSKEYSGFPERTITTRLKQIGDYSFRQEESAAVAKQEIQIVSKGDLTSKNPVPYIAIKGIVTEGTHTIETLDVLTNPAAGSRYTEGEYQAGSQHIGSGGGSQQVYQYAKVMETKTIYETKQVMEYPPEGPPGLLPGQFKIGVPTTSTLGITRVIPVETTVIGTKTIQTTKTISTPKIIEVPKTVSIPKTVGVPKTVSTTKTVLVPKTIAVPKTVSIPKTVGVPKTVSTTKTVLVPKTVQVPKVVAVPKVVSIPKTVQVPKVVPVTKTIQLQKSVLVTKTTTPPNETIISPPPPTTRFLPTLLTPAARPEQKTKQAGNAFGVKFGYTPDVTSETLGLYTSNKGFLKFGAFRPIFREKGKKK